MLLKGYSKEIFRSKCDSSAERVHCFAYLNNNVGAALPYLNAALGGFNYIKEPPSVTFKVYGKLITVHADKIAINALKDEAEADKIISWLQNEINDVWEKRDKIQPSFDSRPQPTLMEILKLLPKTNCRECREPTCMVFAVRVMDGIKDHNDCPLLTKENRQKMKTYLSGFVFDADAVF